MKKIKVALGLSGGVDSAVSAYLLKKQGFDISCVYLNCYDGPPAGGPGCRGDNDRKDALAVAMHLGLPFQVLDFRKEYQAAVIDYFKKEYLLGRTPNPDVICNRDIKFGLFLDWAVKAGFDYVATGHYAKLRSAAFSRKSRNKTKIAKNNSRRSRSFASFANTKAYTYDQLQENNNSVFLVQPRDVHKDQTYFLWAVPKEKFKRVLFPLGNLLKTEVREIAKDAGLVVADKKDSTGICFVGEVRVEDFLKRLGVKEKPGDVVIRMSPNSKSQIPNPKQFQNQNDQNSKRLKHLDLENLNLFGAWDLKIGASDNYAVIGRHKGVWFYTIGQRHGFEINRSTGQQVNRLTGYQDNRPKKSANLITCQPASLKSSSDRSPLYVIEKDIKKNRLIVGFGAETYREKFVVSNLNWLVGSEFFSQTQNSKLKTQNQVKNSKPRTVLVRIRHGGELIPCSVVSSPLSVVSSKSAGYQPAGSGQINRQPTNRKPKTDNRKQITVSLSSPQRGIAPGQSAVFYLPRRSGAKAGSKEGVVLGGGIIQP